MLPVSYAVTPDDLKARRRLTDGETKLDSAVALFYLAAQAELAHVLSRQNHATVDEVHLRFKNVKGLAEGSWEPRFTVAPSGKGLLPFAGKRRHYGAANISLGREEFKQLRKLVETAQLLWTSWR